MPMHAEVTAGIVPALSQVGSAWKLPHEPVNTPTDANCTLEMICPAGQLRMDHRFSAELMHTRGPDEGVTGGVPELVGVTEEEGVLDAVVEEEGVCEAVMEGVAPKVLDAVSAAVPEVLAEAVMEDVRVRAEVQLGSTVALADAGIQRTAMRTFFAVP